MKSDERKSFAYYCTSITEPKWGCHALPWERHPFFTRPNKDFFHHLNQTLEARQLAWCARIAFGEPLKDHDPRQAQVCDLFFQGLWDAEPNYDISDETNAFDRIVEQLFQSEYAWHIELLFDDPYLAVETWDAARFRFSDDLYGEKPEQTAADDYKSFLNTSLYLLSCFTSDDLGLLDPLKTYLYLRDTFAGTLKVIRMLTSTYRKLPNLSSSKKSAEAVPIQNDATLIRGMKITPREEMGGILRRCFKEHLPESFFQENKEYVLTEIQGILDCAYSVPACYYLLPYISAHVFSRFFEVSHDAKPELDRLIDCHSKFPTYKRLYGAHKKSRIFRDAALHPYYQLDVRHPVIGFMDMLLYELHSPQLYPHKWSEKQTGGFIKCLSGQFRFTTVFDYEEQIQVNWLAFYLEQRGYMFDAERLNQVCVLQKWEYVLNQFFEDNAPDASRLISTMHIDCAEPSDAVKQKTKRFLDGLTDIEAMATSRIAVNRPDWESADQTFTFPEEKTAYRRIKLFISQLCEEKKCMTPLQQKKTAEEVRTLVCHRFFSRIISDLSDFFDLLTDYETLHDYSNAVFPDTPMG